MAGRGEACGWPEGKSSAIPGSSPAAIQWWAADWFRPSYASRELGRDLLQIETRGPFAYDAEKNLARFDVLPQADPNLTNDVRATKIPPRPGIQTLFSEVLELDFNSSSAGTPEQTPPAKPTKQDALAKDATSPSAGGTQIKRLHAWTFTPGRFLTISSDSDQMETLCERIWSRVQATETTRITGSPLSAVSAEEQASHCRRTSDSGGPDQ